MQTGLAHARLWALILDHIAELASPAEAAWRAQAACRTAPSADLWFPARGDLVALAIARTVCHRCPVAGDCLAYALARPNLIGIWGGTTDDERNKLRRRR